MSSEAPLDPPTNEQRVDEEEHDEKLVDEQPPAQETPADSLLDAPQEPAGGSAARSISPVLPEIPGADLDLDFTAILNPAAPDPESEKVKKRASNVMKLSQENEKLKAELKAMTDRLEAAERRREQLARKQQHVMDPPSS
ncbi:hypothetical protein FB451DRAFT_1254590 [Mycena latifolia]|nr:hypothetical protein FB451DRAFT_1254590 [Mycena latifolia]